MINELFFFLGTVNSNYFKGTVATTNLKISLTTKPKETANFLQIGIKFKAVTGYQVALKTVRIPRETEYKLAKRVTPKILNIGQINEILG